MRVADEILKCEKSYEARHGDLLSSFRISCIQEDPFTMSQILSHKPIHTSSAFPYHQDKFLIEPLSVSSDQGRDERAVLFRIMGLLLHSYNTCSGRNDTSLSYATDIIPHVPNSQQTKARPTISGANIKAKFTPDNEVQGIHESRQ